MPVALCAGQHFIFPGWMQRSCESEKKRSYGPHRRAGEYGNRADASLIQSYLVGRSGTAIGRGRSPPVDAPCGASSEQGGGDIRYKD